MQINGAIYTKLDTNNPSIFDRIDEPRLLTQIFQRCDRKTLTNVACTSKALQAVVEKESDYKQMFIDHFGALTPKEEESKTDWKLQGSYTHRYLKLANKETLITEVSAPQEKKNWGTKLKHLFFFDAIKREKQAKVIANNKLSTAKSIANSPSKDLFHIKQKIKRLKTLKKELLGVRKGLQATQTNALDRLNAYPAIFRIPVKAIIVLFFGRDALSKSLTKQIDLNIQEINECLGNIKPAVIGETKITLDGKEIDVEICASPTLLKKMNKKIHFTGGTIFSVKEKGEEKKLGSFIVRHAWKDPLSPFDHMIEDSTGDPKGKLENHHLFVDMHQDPNYKPDVMNDDLPVSRLLTQVMVEVFDRQNLPLLRIDTAYHYSHVYVSAGIHAHCKHFDFMDGIKEKIETAHKQGYRYPIPEDEMSFKLDLYKEDLFSETQFTTWKDQSTTKIPAHIWWDVDEQKTTWEEQIKKYKTLSGKGPILPDFWKRDLRKFEK